MNSKAKIVKIVGYFLMAAVFAVFLYTLLNYQELRTNLEAEIQTYGAIGLIVGGFIVDIIAGPLGTEVPVVAGLLTGLDVPTVIYMTFLGSVTASLTVYFFGYFIGEYGALHYVSKEDYKKWKALFIRHRRLTMVLGALTPVPYVIVCLIAGTFKVRLWEYFVFTIGARFVRISGAAYIVVLFQHAA